MGSRRSSSEGRVLLHQLRSVRRVILESLQRGGEISKADIRSLKRLVDVLRRCDRPSEDLDAAKSQFLALRESKLMSIDAVMILESVITHCESDILSFVSEISDVEAGTLDELEPIKRAYLMELEEASGEPQLREAMRSIELTRETVFDMPGMYMKEVHDFLVSRYSMDISYTSIRQYIGELERRQEILTIGGPQGAYRYCFPNPRHVADKEEYYGRPFAISGEIEDRVTSSWNQRAPKRYRDLFVVNSSNPERTLLIVDYEKVPQLTLGTSIVSFGKLQDVDYIQSYEGLEAFDGADEVNDVLIGLKVDVKENGGAIPVWFDKELLGRRSFYSSGAIGTTQ